VWGFITIVLSTFIVFQFLLAGLPQSVQHDVHNKLGSSRFNLPRRRCSIRFCRVKSTKQSTVRRAPSKRTHVLRVWDRGRPGLQPSNNSQSLSTPATAVLSLSLCRADVNDHKIQHKDNRAVHRNTLTFLRAAASAAGSSETTVHDRFETEPLRMRKRLPNVVGNKRLGVIFRPGRTNIHFRPPSEP